MDNVIKAESLFAGRHKQATEALENWHKRQDDPANWPQWKKDIAISLGHSKEIFNE